MHGWTREAHVPILQNQPNIERSSTSAPYTALVCDLSSTPGSSSGEARATFVPRNSKLVSATAKLTKDFKASISTYLGFRTRGDCGLLLKKLVYQQEQLMKLEAGLKAALVDSVSAVQHQIRVEDPAAFGRNGRFRQYRDDHGAAQIQHELPCPTLTPQGRSVFARAESIEPTHGGLPEEALLFIVKNELEIDAVESIAYCMRNIGCLMVSVDLAGNEVRKNEFQGRWWVARPEVMWPRCGLGMLVGWEQL